MLRQKQPNNGSCLATAIAMCLDIPVQEVFDECGHDGTQIIFPGLGGSRAIRGFHVQEMIDFCATRNWAVTTIEARPNRREGDRIFEYPIDENRFKNYMQDSTGVIICQVYGRGHALAWDGVAQIVLDPSDVISDLHHVCIESYLKLDRIHGLD